MGYNCGKESPAIRSCPVVDVDSTIYMDSNDALCALRPDGTLYCTLVYNDTGHGMRGKIVALDRNGSIREMSPSWIGFSRPALGPDGTLYIGNIGYPYYDLLAIETPSMGLANSAWPIYRKDSQRTGKASP